MKMELIYAKYSNNRRKKFQIKTAIYKELDKKIVNKVAIYDEGIEHLKNIEQNYISLCNEYKNCKINQCMKREKNSLSFKYEEGITFDKLLLKLLEYNELEKFIDKLFWYKELLKDFSFKKLDKFYFTKEFKNIFGDEYDKGLQNYDTLKVSNIDMNFDNIVMDDDKITIIDYEWVYTFPIPIDYIIYRAILTFYNSNYNFIKNKISFNEILRIMNIEEFSEIYGEKIHKTFQYYVLAEKENMPKDYMSNYEKKIVDMRDLDGCIRCIENAENFTAWIDELNKQIKAKEDYIEERNKQLIGSQEYIDILQQQLTGLKEYVKILKQQQINNLQQYAENLKKQQLELDYKIAMLQGELTNET